jgi:Ti-type conjugative transfer relaxase TraA
VAIQFARCEYVSRSSGGNACRKASYNQREEIRCERTGELFSFKERGGNVHHEILLPQGADEKFKNSSVLWNEAERCEKRKDSQVAKEFVIALPDDEAVTLEDRIELTRRFGQIFAIRGVAVQLDVHCPHENEGNWHAHFLVTTRRFAENGLTLHEKKATDLDPVIRNRTVIEADLWGEIWRDLQNTYFEEKGYDIRVDPIGIVPQEHLGPVRMRHHLNEAVVRAQLLQKANEKLAQNPLSILEEMTRTQAVFTQKDVGFFLNKHVPSNEREGLLEKVLEHSQALPLYDKGTQKETGYFTTQSVRKEEEKLIRFADSIAKKSAVSLSSISMEKGLENSRLSEEQKAAYDLCVDSEKNLSIIQGRAGVGKSYLLDAIRIAHEAEGYRVLGLAPTNKVAMDLKKEGFEAKTCHSFLFAFKNNRETLDSNTLVVVDEAGMLGTTLSVELFNVIKNKGAKLILVGDDRQLSSVERGGTFRFLSDRYGAAELSEVRRQTTRWQKDVSEALAEGNVKGAVHLLEEHKALVWNATKEESLANLLKDWAKDTMLNPQETRQIIAQRNVDVDALNQGARDLLRQAGQLGEVEMICSTQRGRVAFAEGDRIHLTKKDKSQGLMNGTFGRIEHINPQTKIMTLHLDNGEVKELNPNTYDGLRHGYAATVYKTQGANIASVYALHSYTTNQATNYVGLTRQTKSLSLYVSQDETSSTAHLISQMGRQQERGTSLVFDTPKDIEKRQEEKTLFSPVKEAAEILITKVKDKFHKNEAFYQFEKEKSQPQEAVIKVGGQEVFNQIAKTCEKYLYNYMARDNVPMTSERRERIPLQAERTANFIFHAHTLRGTEPSEQETRLYLLRAKYELDRVPHIKEKLRENWQERGIFDEKKDPLIIHMIAERQASIEGRLYLEAKQAGLIPSSHIPQWAEAEFKINRAEAKTLAVKLEDQYSLSSRAAAECARNALRYQETHGAKPTDTQMSAMAEIAHQIEEKHPDYLERDVGSHNLAYMRRMNGDDMLRERCYEERHAIAHEHEVVKVQEKVLLEAQKQQIQQQVLREKERGFEMSM